MYSTRNQSYEVCRMPWFLVEVKSKDSSSKPHTEYFIVHSVDIDEMQSGNMYVNGCVKFDHNQRVVEGKVVLASEDRAYVENEMQILTSKTESKKRKGKGKLFFVQYSSSSRDLVHAVLPESDIFWPFGIQQNPEEVLVKVAQNQYRATVLLTNDDEKQMENEFAKLKNWCSEKWLNKVSSALSNAATDCWILVQYCKSPQEIIYCILNERETYWAEQNLYKDVVTYINVGETIFQALILAKSKDLQSLTVQINNIKDCAALSSLIQMENIENNALKCTSIISSYQPCSDKIVYS